MSIETIERDQRAIERAYGLASKADAWADRMAHDRRTVLKLLRDKRDQAARRGEAFSQANDAMAASRRAAFDAAIALLEAAENPP